MEVKPIPKPRTIVTTKAPVPAPRISMAPSTPARTRSLSESSQSEKSDESKSQSESKGMNSEFFRNLGTSSRQLKDGISEKMTVKGRAVISSTRNASIRLEKSVKNLLTRRLTTLNSEDTTDGPEAKLKAGVLEDRCVSLPVGDDVFSSISFYSPLHSNLKSMKNEENLTEHRYSLPPPIYPPPPLPDESIYDELQSVTSGQSSRYDTLSSNFSERAERDFCDSFDALNTSSRTLGSDSSDRSSNYSSDIQRTEKRLSRSDSWSFYDVTPSSKSDNDPKEDVNEVDKISLMEEIEAALQKERSSCVSNISSASLTNSLYENWSPVKTASTLVLEASKACNNRQKSSKSMILEFDPFARNSMSTLSTENNDLLLLETLLATSDTPSSNGSLNDLTEIADQEDPDVFPEPNSLVVAPPPPPKRFDSLPKHEYDEVEMVPEESDKTVTKKNPPLLPKLAHLARKKQPAVPPRKPAPAKADTQTSKEPGDLATSSADCDKIAAIKSSSVTAKSTEERKTGMMHKIKWFTQESTSHVKPNMMSFVRHGSKLLSRNKENSANSTSENPSVGKSIKGKRLERPKIAMNQNPPTHRGILYKPGAGIERTKDLVSRAAVLSDQKLSLYTDKSMATLKEVIQLVPVQSLHLLQDIKVVDGETVHCLAISSEGRSGFHLLYAKGTTERRIWAQKLLEVLTPVFPVKSTSDLTRAGWAYLKEGVTGTWLPAWVLLQQRTLVYTKSTDPVILEYLDLRKARCIVIREQDGPIAEHGNVPVVVVDAGGKGALHLTAPGPREVPAWKHALYQAATNCGPALDQQQLTQDNVPVIVDKCINFIYAHGIMSEGIYRHSGSSSAVARLLEALRRDAWATQITKASYSEHDVATVLRRFLRDLSDPLFPSEIHGQLCQTTDIDDEKARIEAYRNLLSALKVVTSATLRRILAHLHCLCQKSSTNLMNVENMSAVWGPMLMHAGENSAEEWNRTETKVIGDLIRLYPKIYQLSELDLEKEAKILEILERHHASNGLRRARSGDLKIWIYILSKDGECIDVTIGPQKSAFDVCRELASNTNFPPHELCLEEYNLHGCLERPLHYTEKVLEVVVRWGYWEPEDRKDNVLILKKDQTYEEILPLVKPPMTMSGELKFADMKSKNFKSYVFEFSQAKLSCYKDKVCSVKLHEWKIEDIVWYLGHEPKRNPQMGWSITFMDKNKNPTRCKENPYFGFILAGISKVDQYRWLAAMVFGEYQLKLRPLAVNLIDP